MQAKIFRWSITAALAGFLFGFDTAVISGAESAIQTLWQLDPLQHGLAVSIALWGTVLGAIVGSWPTDRWGRRRTLSMIGVLYLVSALWSALATDVYTFMIARFLGGLGVGISTVAAPLFIAEISPPERRGRLAGLFQFNIVLGILVAFASNALLGGLGEGAWRWMLGIEAIPAVVFAVLSFQLPESPRWLVGMKGDEGAAAQVLRVVLSDRNESGIQEKIAEIRNAANDEVSRGNFWSSKLRRPITLALALAFFNQLSGINAIIYFAPRIFEMTGMGNQAALLQSVGIGVTNLLFTFVGLWLIDRAGRKFLLFWGALGNALTLGAVSLAFITGQVAWVPWCIFGFIAFFALGQGAVIWVYIGEIFPNRHRAEGQSLGSATHWVFAAGLTLVFPSVVTLFAPEFVFGFFCLMMLLQLVWILVAVPETRGQSLETLEHELVQIH